MNNKKLHHWRNYIKKNFNTGFNGKTNWSLKRQKKTVHLILEAMKRKSGVIVADDVGLGKTWVGILTAIAIADSGGRVVICAPNPEISKKWGDEIESWWGYSHEDAHPDLKKKNPQPDLDYGIKGRDWDQVMPYRILIISHHDYKTRITPWKCDLLIIDEAHRGKSTNIFYDKNESKFTLLLTATPFGKDPKYLMSLLNIIGCKDTSFFNPIFKDEIRMEQWDNIQKELSKWMIRHTFEDLIPSEKKLICPKDIKSIKGSFDDNKDCIGIPLNEKMEKLILHVERLHYLDKNIFEKNPTITLPYFPQAISKIIKNKESDDCLVQFHLNELKKITQSGVENPLITELKEFAKKMLMKNNKFIIFCYHHEVADTVNEVLQQVWKEYHKSDKPVNKDNLYFQFKTILDKWVKNYAKNCDKDIQDEINNTKDVLKSHLVILEKYLIHSKKINETELFELFSKIHQHRHVLKKLQLNDSSGTKFRTVPKLNLHEDILKLFFNYPIPPYALVLTGKDSEGIDLHRQCRLLVHFELSYRPELTLQANGRIRRINSLAAKEDKPIIYFYPYLKDTRSESLTNEAFKRLESFGKILGGTHTSDSSLSNMNFSNKHYTGNR